MKKEKLLITLATGAGAASVAYAVWPKKKIAGTAIVDPFDIHRYLGTWHEVARLPNAIEKNLKDLTEEYLLDEGGNFKVITRAFNSKTKKPVEATGKIKFKGAETRGQLAVAYFLPIFLDYNVLAVDDNYQHALVSGSGTSYLWLLSRENHIPDDITQRFLDKATLLGFEVSKLQWM